jgi:hypothetical protein
MEIGTINLNDLRNEEHFQFQTDVKNLVESKGADALNIKVAYGSYVPVYDNERTALDKIRKSAISEDVANLDSRRDSTFRGTSDAENSALRHFNPSVQGAAKRIKVIFDHYGNLAPKPYDEETAAINALITNLNDTCQADMETIRIEDWVAQLQLENDEFVTLKNNRYTEEAS